MPIKLNSTGGGSVSIDVPSTASTYTLTAPALTGNFITSADSNTVSTTMLADSGITAAKMGYSGAILNISTIRNSTRTSVPNSGATTLFSGSFTKIRAASTLIAKCTVYGCQYSSGTCGVGMNIDGSNWDYGVAYQYDGAWSATAQITIVIGTSRWTGISAGSHTVGFGFNPINGATAERPFGILNPNNSDDSRNQQTVSSIVVYEVI